MKKFRVEVALDLRQYVCYEVEAEGVEQVKELVLDGCIEDYGTPIDETIPEVYNKDFGMITEVKNDK